MIKIFALIGYCVTYMTVMLTLMILTSPMPTGDPSRNQMGRFPMAILIFGSCALLPLWRVLNNRGRRTPSRQRPPK